MAERILVVDDERDLLGTLEYNLSREGYDVVCAETGAGALRLARAAPHPDLILLDLMLPDMSGTEVCSAIRREEATHAIPILMLTARGGEIDRVVGFEVGADDYVVKPFSTRELLLRVRAILRRVTSPEPPSSEVAFGRVRIDPEAHRVWVDGEEVTMTALELRLLRTLHERRGRVQTRERLLSDVWGIDADVTTRTVDTHIKRLREKLGPAAGYVETVRGVGYRMRSRPEDGLA